MNAFAKLFKVEEHQVLLTIDFDDETEEDFLEMKTQIQGLIYSMKLEGFSTEGRANEAFEEYNQEKAETFFIAMKNLLTNSEEEG